ncbi:hypothetical protein LXL04_006030 [Taraxacum kok-saghyz]
MTLSGRPAPFFAANGCMPTSPRPKRTRTDIDFTSGVSLGMERFSSPLSFLLLTGSSGFGSRPAACSARCI